MAERNFKESFKFYKARFPAPDLSEVVDVDNASEETCSQFKAQISGSNPFPLILKPPDEWLCYEVNNRPGLIFIRNPFTALGQRYWVVRSVRDYPQAPNVVNLIPKKFEKEVVDDWWRAFRSAKDPKFRENLKASMRWATLGYHHDWDTKVYSESMKNEFPTDLRKMTKFFAKALGYGKYSAEAAIVNFYPLGTTLSGHTDHSEADLDAPLFSFSFGQKAIFLIGGPTKEEPATALFLRSGDVVVMSKQSRLCYHAVPKVMKDCLEPWKNLGDSSTTVCEKDEVEQPNCKKMKEETSDLLAELLDDCRDDSFWKPFQSYLDTTRININIRQVLKDGQTSL